ncbi:MAG TPA: MATE family efflux transporter [Caulobacteraceae bacterium]|jgi:putative MATE family efflux protein
MRDLTEGSITRHLAGMAGFIAVGLIVQTLYFLIDLYFVSRLGSDAIAGVSAAGNSFFLVLGLSQVVAIGSLALIAQAVGRKDPADARLVFNQAMGMGLAAAALTLVLGYGLAGAAMGGLGASPGAAAAGRAYLFAFLPSLAITFPMAAVGAALRACGVVRPTMLAQTGSVILNAVLAPVLIAGWGTGVPLGVAGAGLASSISVAIAFAALLVIFPRVQDMIRVTGAELKPRLAVWRRIVVIGLPAAGEFLMLFIVVSVVFWVIRGFGPQAQAGFGVGSRVMQAIFVPAMAVAFAAAPIAGQNFGAGKAGRVRRTFRDAAVISCGVMLALTLLCQWNPRALVAPFTSDAAAAAVAAGYLGMISWNFVGNGLVFVCSAMFQALGDTRPAFLSAATRMASFVLPALWLAGRPNVTLEDFWRLSLLSITLQAVVSLVFLRLVFRRKLDAGESIAPAPAAA